MPNVIIITRELVIEDMERIAQKLNNDSFKQKDYAIHGSFGLTTLRKRLDLTFSEAKQLAGLKVISKRGRAKGDKNEYQKPAYLTRYEGENKLKDVVCQCNRIFKSPVDSKGSALCRTCSTCKQGDAWKSNSDDAGRYGITLGGTGGRKGRS